MDLTCDSTEFEVNVDDEVGLLDTRTRASHETAGDQAQNSNESVSVNLIMQYIPCRNYIGPCSSVVIVIDVYYDKKHGIP